MRLRGAIALALTILAAVASSVVRSTPAAAAGDDARFVPQLELTDLQPAKVAFAPDDPTLLMVVNSHGRIDLFDISNPGRPAKVTEIAAAAIDAAFTPKGTHRDKLHIVSGGKDGTVRLWTFDGKPAAEPFKGHQGWVLSVAFSPDGTRIISGGVDGTVRLWTLDGKPAAEPFKGHQGGVLSVAFSRDGTRIVSGGVDGTVRLWTLDGKPAAEPFKGHQGAVLSVAFSPDGTRIVSGGLDGTVRLWTLDGKPAAEPFKGHESGVWSVAFSPDGTRIVSGGEDGTVRLWTLDGKPAAEPFKGHQGWVWSVAFSPDGTRIVSGGEDGTVRLWTLDGKPAAEPFKGHQGAVLSVAFSPDGTRIVSGGRDGTVRLWTLDGKPAAEPFKGHEGGVRSVAFSPEGTRIVSGGEDGTVRLWTLDGKPAAEPFKGHQGWVWSVAFSRDGTRIVSGGEDGTVRLWTLPAGTSSVVLSCLANGGLGFADDRLLWIGCSDRLVIRSPALAPRGELFLHKEGLVAHIYGKGVYLPNDRIQDAFRTISTGGQVVWQRHAVPEVSIERARQVLLDEWTLPDRIHEYMNQAYAGAKAGYEWLGWWKVPFWPALGWLIGIIISVGIWLFAPHRLSSWAMRSVGSPEVPTWKWIAGIFALFGYLGTTRRSLRAWLRKHREALYEQNFAGRTPVKERKKYCNLGHEAEISAFARNLAAHKAPHAWISGVGGSGKSALAYRMLRAATEAKPLSPLPILVDEDWQGVLLDHVVGSLKVGNRIPTPRMVEVLGSGGDLCLLIDSLSERGMTDAVNRVAEEVAKGNFTSVIVTSRQPRPDGRVWQAFKPIVALPLTPEQIPLYVVTYAPPEYRAEVSHGIAPLVAASQSVSPLFMRFAIEQALARQAAATSSLDLVLQYVEALRAGRLDLSADDMLRAASIAAIEAVRESLAPREIEWEFLRGVLVAKAGAMAFNNARNNKSMDPAEVIELLVGCGLLNRNVTNRRLQFAYDPVAEHLAARAAAQAQPGTDVASIEERILSEPGSAIARVMAEIGVPLPLRPHVAEPAAAATI